MRNGWIKLHRRILDNDFLKRDHNAKIVFITLLLLVDRKTGIWEGGRIQLSEYCGLKPTTSYAASMRLVKAKMMTLRSNNKYSTYTVSNWSKYQGNGDSNDDNKMTTRRQQDDTLTRSKEVKNNPHSEEYNKLLKHIKEYETSIHSPSKYLGSLVEEYGSDLVDKLSRLNIGFNEWKTNLEHWNNK